MKQRLLIVNLALLVAFASFGYLLRERWREADRRKQQILGAKLPPAPAPPAAKPPEPPARAASYFDVAEKMLFTRDRNPTVVVEVPQEKPVPPLPAAFGVMDLGQGPVVFLAEKGASQRGYKTGEKIGEFTLASVTSQEIAFAWEGKTIRKRLEDLRPEPGAGAQQQQPATTAQPALAHGPAAAALSGAAASTTTNAGPAAQPSAAALGADAGVGMKYCKPDDTSPPGTVVDGFRKVVGFSPIGRTCYWEAVK